MASKSSLVLAIILFGISSSLPIEGRQPEHKFELGNLFIGGKQSNRSIQNSTGVSLLEAGSDGYTLVAGYYSIGADSRTWWHGVRAQIDVWNIQNLQPQSESSVYITAVHNDNIIGQEFVTAGFHVYPQLHNDSVLRFFTFWRTTKDGLQGCYNTYCPGFVVANDNNLHPGQALAPLSTYGGERRYVTLRIKKDEETGDWSLYREDEGGPIGGMTLLGWWPQSLFKTLSDHANIIQWSGEVNYKFNETGPPMGSGHLPGEGIGKSASFFDCFGFDYDGHIYNDDYKPIRLISSDKTECYDVSPWYDSGKPKYKHFYYGGPGGCSK